MLWGQWWGVAEGSERAEITLNIDRQTPLRGRVLVVQRQPEYSAVVAEIQFDGDAAGANAEFRVEHVQPAPSSWEEKRGTGTVRIQSLDAALMEASWTTGWGTAGTAKLRKMDDIEPSKPLIRFDSWSDFKKWIASEERPKAGRIFRGQSDAYWTLTTTFHRHGRRDLIWYNSIAVPHLSEVVSGTIDRLLDSNDATERGSLLYLAQHHGFPTPLLDWTESPYIGAFFAFLEADRARSDSDVRVFIFDRRAWQARVPITVNSDSPELFFNIQRFLPRANPRALPQQSIVTSTNIAQPEFWLRLAEAKFETELLRVVDLSRALRDEAIDDLAYMGISAASLFPGLDGVCRALRERYF